MKNINIFKKINKKQNNLRSIRHAVEFIDKDKNVGCSCICSKNS